MKHYFINQPKTLTFYKSALKGNLILAMVKIQFLPGLQHLADSNALLLSFL